MSENPNKHNEDLSAEQEEIANEWLAKYETPEIPTEERRDASEIIASLESIYTSFEEAFDIEELSAITNPTPLEVPQHPVRDGAKEWLKPMTQRLTTLKETTNVTPDKLAELKAKYKRYSNAVGMVNKKSSGEYVIEHDR